MDFKVYTASADDSGRRLDRVVSRILEMNSVKTGVYSLIRKGLVKVNGKKSSQDYRICQNDEIGIAKFIIDSGADSRDLQTAPKTKSFPFTLESITLFRNEHFLIVNKPSGINVQPSKDCDFCLSDMVEEDFGRSNHTSVSFKPGPLHRIDRYTSGIVAFSQSLAGARWFCENMESHKIKKTYLGITRGNYESEFETYRDNIYVPENSTGSYGTVVAGTSKGKEAVTSARFIKKVLLGEIECNLMEFSIDTGRKHQIRAQSAFHGHPLWGDTAYGGEKCRDGKFRLHAWKIQLPENSLGLPGELIAPCPFYQ